MERKNTCCCCFCWGTSSTTSSTSSSIAAAAAAAIVEAAMAVMAIVQTLGHKDSNTHSTEKKSNNSDSNSKSKMSNKKSSFATKQQQEQPWHIYKQNYRKNSFHILVLLCCLFFKYGVWLNGTPIKPLASFLKDILKRCWSHVVYICIHVLQILHKPTITYNIAFLSHVILRQFLLDITLPRTLQRCMHTLYCSTLRYFAVH